MNIENIRKVQDLLRAHPEQFDMTKFGDNNTRPPSLDSCGTAGCIAGWAAALAGDPIPGVTEPLNGDWRKRSEQIKAAQRAIVASAARYLGLGPVTFEEASYGMPNEDVPLQLFFIDNQSYLDDHLTLITADDAIAALDALIMSGEPAWPDLEDRL